MNLRLRLPRQDDAIDRSLETRPPYLEEWIEELPWTDTLNVIAQLYERLRQLNKAPLKPALRAELLEIFLPAMAYLRDAQLNQAAARSTGTFDRQRVDIDGIRQVANQLAFGSKLILAQSISTHALLGGRRRVRLGTQRATQWLSLALIFAYCEYLPSVPHAWFELGELYRYARSEDLHTDVSQGINGSDLFSDSVELAYKRILLLGLVNPLRLGYGEVWLVYDWLGQVADKVELQPLANIGQLSDSSWLIDTNSDHGPTPASMAGTYDESASFALDPRPVSQALNAMANDLPDAKHKHLAQHCAALMCNRRSRGVSRESMGGQLDIVSGISAMYHFISGKNTSSPPPSNPDVDGEEIEISTPAPNNTAAIVCSPTYRCATWDIINHSDEGYGLRRTTQSSAPLLVGEIIALRNTKDRWAIGVVRWMTVTSSDDFRIGVEILSQRVRTVEITTSCKCGADKHKGLLLPGRAGPGTVRLLTASHVASSNKELFATTSRRVLRLRQIELLEAGPGVEVIACQTG